MLLFSYINSIVKQKDGCPVGNVMTRDFLQKGKEGLLLDDYYYFFPSVKTDSRLFKPLSCGEIILSLRIHISSQYVC